MQTTQNILQLKEEDDYLKKYHCASEMCTVYRHRTLSRWYIKNLDSETEHFPYGTSEMFTLQRNRTLFRRYIRNM